MRPAVWQRLKGVQREHSTTACSLSFLGSLKKARKNSFCARASRSLGREGETVRKKCLDAHWPSLTEGRADRLPRDQPRALGVHSRSLEQAPAKHAESTQK